MVENDAKVPNYSEESTDAIVQRYEAGESVQSIADSFVDVSATSFMQRIITAGNQARAHCEEVIEPAIRKMVQTYLESIVGDDEKAAALYVLQDNIYIDAEEYMESECIGSSAA